jgi:hydroxyacylglutathione hydrolase
MEQIGIGNITVYRFESEYLGTNMYVLFSDGTALIVDPHPAEEAKKILEERHIEKTVVFLTHEHPDHTYGLPWLKEITDFHLICHRKCAETIAVEKNNRPILMTFVLERKDEENGTTLTEKFARSFHPFSFKADIVFDDMFLFNFDGISFSFTATPGHSKGSCCIKMNESAVFTGDNLIRDTPVITRFPGGSLKEFNERTKPYLDSLPDEIIVLSGHGQIFKMKEARRCGT